MSSFLASLEMLQFRDEEDFLDNFLVKADPAKLAPMGDLKMPNDPSDSGRSPPEQHPADELLIASVTPQNLERGVLWFAEHGDDIRGAQQKGANPWWRANTIFIEIDRVLKHAEFTRRLLDLGYERASAVRGRGLFAVRGGIIDVWPVNTARPWLIEFIGNRIASLQERPDTPETAAPLPNPQRQSIAALNPGSFIVHQDHGIGIFVGIGIQGIEIPMNERQTQAHDANTLRQRFNQQNNQQNDEHSAYFIIEYARPRPGAKPDMLYVPMSHENRLTPYVGFENPKIHRLGAQLWHRTRRKVKEDMERMARQLLELYAERHLTKRAVRRGDPLLEESFRQTFPYQETPDQLRAETEILHDLERAQPMDRVLCGDVGFGKTEVAARAALRVIASGCQVALLAPTTVLAAQHLYTLTQRFADLPVRIRMLSRLISKKEERDILASIQNGSIDCVIGTHRILSRDVIFKNLGLFIIDEEQRFGVKQKELLTDLKKDIDILSLSATPIPRTLQFTLARLRDISLLATPPPDRLPIQTVVLPYSRTFIADAIATELERGGQVYVLHNRIETIAAARARLERMLPGAIARQRGSAPHHARQRQSSSAIGVIHGRMPEKEIIKTMERFRNKKITTLLATTIIENGLDISSANTLIVDEATRLGLAQAHQLRGRIGRGNRQAYAYFLYRPSRLTPKAAQRLAALQEYADLGAGYQLAMRDLEIRGSGNILGRAQSGAINKVGLNLYYQMLAQTMEQLRATSTTMELV